MFWCLLDPPKTCSFVGLIKLCCILTSLFWGTVDSFAGLFDGFSTYLPVEPPVKRQIWQFALGENPLTGYMSAWPGCLHVLPVCAYPAPPCAYVAFVVCLQDYFCWWIPRVCESVWCLYGSLVREGPTLVCACLSCASACVLSALGRDIQLPARVHCTTIERGLTQSIMGAWWWHLQLAFDSADSLWLHFHCHLLHAPPRPDTYPSTHTTPVYTTSLDHTLGLVECQRNS